MSVLDHNKARAAILEWEATEPMPLDDLLNRLEETVQPPRAFVVHSEEEYRGRIRAEANLARIEALLDDETLGDHLYPADIRTILRGDQ